MKFEKIKRKRIYEEVLSQLQEYLANGDVEPGQKLPSERELAKLFNVNRFSIREALTILETNGLVKRKVGEGTFSVDPVEFTATSMLRIVAKNQNSIKEPMQARRIIEPQIARLAALAISDAQLQYLEELLQRQKERLENGIDIIDLDNEFHSSIAKATNNILLVELLNALHNSISGTRIKSNQARGGGESGYKWHRKIFAALKRRNPEESEEAMLFHLLEVERLILDYYAERNPDYCSGD